MVTAVGVLSMSRVQTALRVIARFLQKLPQSQLQAPNALTPVLAQHLANETLQEGMCVCSLHGVVKSLRGLHTSVHMHVDHTTVTLHV